MLRKLLPSCPAHHQPKRLQPGQLCSNQLSKMVVSKSRGQDPNIKLVQTQTQSKEERKEGRKEVKETAPARTNDLLENL